MDMHHDSLVTMGSSKVQQGGGKESRSARGRGTGHMDLVEELDWLDEDKDDEVVWIESS